MCTLKPCLIVHSDIALHEKLLAGTPAIVETSAIDSLNRDLRELIKQLGIARRSGAPRVAAYIERNIDVCRAQIASLRKAR